MRQMATLSDIGIAMAAFVVAAAVGAALGAANFGTALGIGQVAFVLTAAAVIVFRR